MRKRRGWVQLASLLLRRTGYSALGTRADFSACSLALLCGALVCVSASFRTLPIFRPLACVHDAYVGYIDKSQKLAEFKYFLKT